MSFSRAAWHSDRNQRDELGPTRTGGGYRFALIPRYKVEGFRGLSPPKKAQAALSVIMSSALGIALTGAMAGADVDSAIGWVFCMVWLRMERRCGACNADGRYPKARITRAPLFSVTLEPSD
jgi:hypothetical protein